MDLEDFVRERFEGLQPRKYQLDIVWGCLAAGHDDPSDVVERVAARSWFRESSELPTVVSALERVFAISREAAPGDPDASKLGAARETALLAAHRDAAPKLIERIDRREVRGALQLIARARRTPGDRCFDEVFVIDAAHPPTRRTAAADRRER